MAKKKAGLKMEKLSRQKAKLLMRNGGELEQMIMGRIQKFNKGGKRKLGGGNHNTYSGKSKKR